MPSSSPENTAARVALWRALHVEIDAPPHVFEDEVGLQLVAPAPGWQDRPDMSAFTRPFRASIVARARFIEDLVAGEVERGVDQYVILGAGLDTFAQRKPELASRLSVFEIDQPGPQAWKRERLVALGHGIPSFLHLVPVDFEAGEAWWERLVASGFDPKRPAVVASTGVSMYLTRQANTATLRQVAALAPRAAGTPFLSFFAPAEIVELARTAGFRHVEHCRPMRSRSVTSPPVRTACALRGIRTSCWSQRRSARVTRRASRA